MWTAILSTGPSIAPQSAICWAAVQVTLVELVLSLCRTTAPSGISTS